MGDLTSLATKRKGDFEPYWQDEKDWFCTVEFLPTDDSKARLFAADIIGYLFGYANLTNTRLLALLGDSKTSAYELLFSFSSPEEKNQSRRAHRALPPSHITPHGGLRNVAVGQPLLQRLMNPMGRVPLLARSLAVGLQDRIDDILDRPQLGTGPFRSLPFRRQRTPQSFPHHPPVHTKLACYSSNRPLTVLVLSPHLLE
jgi:hypothetical protein